MQIKNDSFLSRKSSKFPNTAAASNLDNPQIQKERRKSRHHKNVSSPRVQLQNQSFLNFSRTGKQSQKMIKIQNFSINDDIQNSASRQEQSIRTSYRSSKLKNIPSINQNQNNMQLNGTTTNNFNTISHQQKISAYTSTAFKFISQNKKYKSIYDSIQRNNKKLSSTLKDFKQKQEYDRIKQFISKQLYIKQNQQEFKDKFQFSISNNINNANNGQSVQKYLQNENENLQISQDNLKKKIANSKKINSRFLLNKLKDNTITIQQTSLEKQKLKKNLFFSDHRKVINLQQKCMLLEYYYKDQERHKLDIKYLRKLTSSSAAATSSHTSPSSRHKRISKKSSLIQKTYLLHRESQIKIIQKIMYVKEDKAQLQAIRDAKKNYTFKRERNFKQMQEIIKENHQHLMLQEQHQNQQSQQHLVESGNQKQDSKDTIFSLQGKSIKKNFNKFMKLFMNFAVNSEVHRIYFDYIDLVGIQKLKAFLQQIQQNISTKLYQTLVGKVLQYKSKVDKNIKFYDFIQLITQISRILVSKNKINTNSSNNISALLLLKKVQSKCPSIFEKSQQIVYSKHQKQIQTYINQNSLNVHLKFLFNKSQSQHKDYIPVKNIAAVFQTYKLISNQLSLSVSKTYEFCMWVQTHKDGLNFSQFSKAVFMICINNKKWKEGAKNFFQKLRKQINV